MSSASLPYLAVPYGSFVSTGACNLDVAGSNPGRSSWLCIYGDPNCLKAWGVQCCLYMVICIINNP